MAFDPVLEPGERISADISFSNRPIRRLVLTNRAAYWSGSKFALFDSITTERVPLSQVISVSIRTNSYQGRLIVGFSMLIGGFIGIIMAAGGFVGARRNMGVAVLLFVVGMNFAARGGRRRTLIIASEGTEFSWTEPGTIGPKKGSSMFEQARAWAQSNGLRLEVELEE